ncbi:FG-GAP repeat domain-containing protein [Desulfogranum mediterraneum]|uniref:FG-GAP repeat domain-containing protein n=1 Tax=Desulfogranum mediterraneum TaxID=160661 RepID=UPI0004201916|nr:VCBS repeat-containing protein [Desulfogranum mediterraneum]
MNPTTPTASPSRRLSRHRAQPLVRLSRLLPLLLLVILLMVNQAWAESGLEKRPRVLFLPFTINLEGSYTYLENGLTSVLSSRLAGRANIQAVADNQLGSRLTTMLRQGKVNAFRQALTKARADYLVLGSLDREGSAYNLSCFVFTSVPGTRPLKLEEPLPSIDEAMAAMDNLSWKISAQVFGRSKPVKAGNPAEAGDGVAAFHTAHPDRSYRQGLFTSGELELGMGDQFQLVNSRRSKPIYAGIQDMNSTDLDGDGSLEIALLSNDQLRIYRYQQERFQQISSLELSRHLRRHSVTFADLNADGLQEIYLSGNNGNRPSSSVIRWQDGTLQLVTEDIPYYLRAVSLAGEQPVLYGQSGKIDTPNGGAIYELEANRDGSFSRIRRLELPQGTEIYSFIIADINGDAEPETVLITPNNRLQVRDQSNRVLWTSGRSYGAGRNFFGTLSSNEKRAIRVPAYIKTRLVVSDVNRDGVKDVVVGDNVVETVPFMPRLRYFDGSSISALHWQGKGLTPLWETKKIPAYTVNYQLSPWKGSPEGEELELLFCAADSSYPFAFWQTDAATINRYLLRRTAEAPAP